MFSVLCCANIDKKKPGKYLLHIRGGEFSNRGDLDSGSISVVERTGGEGRGLRDLLGKSDVDVPAWFGGGVLFKKEPLKKQHRRYVILEGLETFKDAPGKVFESLNYPDTFLESSFRDFFAVHALYV